MMPAFEPQIVEEPGFEIEPGAVILQRLKDHTDDDHRAKTHKLRMIAANKLDITSGSAYGTSEGLEEYEDEEVAEWEDARHNPVGVNTQIQVKSLAFHTPKGVWKGCDADPANADLLSDIRQAYLAYEWERQKIGATVQKFAQDAIISGRGNILVWERDGAPCVEWADDINVVWDCAFKEPHLRRFCFVTKKMPRAEAIRHYPELANVMAYDSADMISNEKDIAVTKYYSPTAIAVLHKRQVASVKPNILGRIPVVPFELWWEPGIKYPTGLVEKQLGMLRGFLTLQRAWRETAYRSVPPGFAVGPWNEEDLERTAAGEFVINRSASADSKIGFAPGPQIDPQTQNLLGLLNQQMNEASGVQDFQKGRTDTNVDFASQLSMIAAQSGVQGKYVETAFQEATRAVIDLFMYVASIVDKRTLSLPVRGRLVEFNDATMPLSAVLGNDGYLELVPGGMTYKAPMQRLQEVMLFGQVIMVGAQLPPGLAPQFVKMAADAFEVDNSSEWEESVAQGIQDAIQLKQAELTAQAASGASQPGSGKAPSQQPSGGGG